MLVDLHLHTTCSDGVWSAQRLFDEIRSRALEAFCVSDHDNLDAYPVPADLADRAICGLEVDSHHDGRTTHLLAYGVSENESPLLQALVRQREARRERMLAMIERCATLGIEVTMEDVRAQSADARSLGRPHLARALVARGYVTTVQEAFDRYLADEGDGYVALERLTSADAISLIRESGGVAVVAHPKRLSASEHLVQLIEAGADGIEVIHPTANADDVAALSLLARDRGLLVTGGTDFHAPVEGRPIGVELAKNDVDALRNLIVRRANVSYR